MANKSLKFLNAVIKEDEDENQNLIIEVDSEKLNLIEEIKKFKDVEFVNLKLGKARKGGKGTGRKPTFTYICPECGKEVKSTLEDLQIKCIDCDKEFKQEN